MATTKCQFTLPADLMADVDRLTSAKKGVGLAGILSRTGERFSRDRFLNDVLSDELSRFQRVPENSLAAYQLLREAMLEARRRAPFKQINILLERSVAERLKLLCESKRIPRDELMRHFLSHAASGLRQARQMANSPTDAVWDDGEPYRELHLSQDDVAERRDSLHVIEAIAGQKGVSFGAAQEAYWRLPSEKRQRLRSSPKIKSAVADLKTRSAATVDLSGLLPLAEQRRLRVAAARKTRRSKRRKSQ